MKLTTILFTGAAVLAMPAVALAASDTSATSSQANASASDSAGASIVSSVPDTEKKYRAASRASDFRKEAETTKELNQQISNAAGAPQTQP